GIALMLTAGHTLAQSSSSDRTEAAPEAKAENEQPESAQASPADSADAAPAAEDGEEELICRREQVTGTHRRVRRCYSPAQLEEQREQARDFLRNRPRRAPNEGG
ncbi:MAG: hypothetical protein R3305_09865, partial [Gammaproteobacteria bacterium]|nr:hypothetical protein [Gammaproteobacteria bacterium]